MHANFNQLTDLTLHVYKRSLYAVSCSTVSKLTKDCYNYNYKYTHIIPNVSMNVYITIYLNVNICMHVSITSWKEGRRMVELGVLAVVLHVAYRRYFLSTLIIHYTVRTMT